VSENVLELSGGDGQLTLSDLEVSDSEGITMIDETTGGTTSGTTGGTSGGTSSPGKTVIIEPQQQLTTVSEPTERTGQTIAREGTTVADETTLGETTSEGFQETTGPATEPEPESTGTEERTGTEGPDPIVEEDPAEEPADEPAEEPTEDWVPETLPESGGPVPAALLGSSMLAGAGILFVALIRRGN
jgi:hypothetical protein